MEDRKASLRTGPMRRRIARAVARFLVSIPEVKDSLEEAAAHAVTHATRGIDREIEESVECAVEDSVRGARIDRQVEEAVSDLDIDEQVDKAIEDGMKQSMEAAAEDIDQMVKDAFTNHKQRLSIEEEMEEEKRLRALITEIVKDNVANFFVSMMEAASRKEK